MPVDHVNIPIADLEASKAFSAAALAPLGFELVYEGPDSLGNGRGDGGDDDEPTGGPGDRPYGRRYYAAFVIDPDGHNIEAVYKGGS